MKTGRDEELLLRAPPPLVLLLPPTVTLALPGDGLELRISGLWWLNKSMACWCSQQVLQKYLKQLRSRQK